MKAIVLALLCIVAVDVSAQIGVALYPQTNPIPEDEIVVWTLTVWNEGGNPLDNVEVSVVLPDNIDSFTAPEGTSCDGGSY